ncbi:MAG: PH domain-containing protein [Sphingomonas sp.]
MKPATLHHSAAALWRYLAIGLVMAVVAILFDTSRPDPDYRGRSAWLVHLLGPTGLWWAMLVFGLASLTVAAASLRLLLSDDRMAAEADADGVVVRTLFGTKTVPWEEVADVAVRSVRAGRRTHHLLQIKRTGRRTVGLSAATIDGGVDAVRDWIEQAAAWHRQWMGRR